MRFSALGTPWLRRSGLLALAVLAFSGCGGGSVEESDDNHGYGWHYDEQSFQGIKIRYSSGRNLATPQGDWLFFDIAFADLRACTGLDAQHPPFLILVPKGTLGAQAGLYFSSPPLVVIEDDVQYYRHESLHYLLEAATGNPDSSHTSPLFGLCTGTLA